MLTVENSWAWRDAIPEEVTMIQLFRPLKSGEGRIYEAMEFADGAKGIGLFLTRQLLKADTEGAYGLIDLKAANGDIVDEIGIPDAGQFQRLRRKLGCRVLDLEGMWRARREEQSNG